MILRGTEMNFKIILSEDAELIATLNHDVQMLHHEIEPEIFKPYNHKEMTIFFNDLLDKGSKAYIAYEDKVAAGYIMLSIKHQDENAFKKSYSVLSIDQICVESSFKGKGIGKALIDFSKDIASKQNINRIEMNYWTQNENSGQFFRSQGFSNYNERLSYSIGDNS